MPMTPDAKRALSTTIRALRTRLLEDLHAATETAYRLSVPARQAGLDAAAQVRRARLEEWIAEQERTQSGGAPTGKPTKATKASKANSPTRTAEDFRHDAEKQAAYTLLNRLVLLRLMEAPGPQGTPLRAPPVLTGGWQSRAYQDFRELAPALCRVSRGNETEGYALLLQLVFEELATELPGLYGPAGVADLVPIPAATLRHVVDTLDDGALESCWSDDMTLGWVYQYWNDPEREALDAKLNDGGKVEPHEIASKTQMFTERYMVDWLLQNSLGPMWLAMCQKHGWTPEVEADGTLAALEERRTAWRAQRELGPENGGVELTALMPLHTEAERRWAYYVPQPIPESAVEQAPDTLRDLRLLDPAVGSGHFLVVALGFSVALYREEARHRGLEGTPSWTDQAIVERILSHNLHGIDLDPRAVQIAAAALWLAARHVAPDAKPERLNLVAANLRLASLPDTDPALVELRQSVEQETGIPGALTDTLIHALRGADHLGSLLKVDKAVEAALDEHERTLPVRYKPQQQHLFEPNIPQQAEMTFEREVARATMLERLEGFLDSHTRGDDLGLRLRGEQLAAGVRFVRMVQEGTYDLVVANPPYQGTSKLAESKYVEQHYALGKADLYAAFLLRGLELVRPGGVSSMLTMRNWMFIKQYSGLREHLLGTYDLRAIGDLAVGAFDEVPNDVLSVTVSVFHHAPYRPEASIAQQPTPPDDRSYDRVRTQRKRAATLCHVGRHTFDPAALKVVPEWPLVYWWGEEFLARYQATPKLGDGSPCKVGIVTGNNVRFVRSHSELADTSEGWASYVAGARGMKWIDPCDDRIRWSLLGLETKVLAEKMYGSHTRQVRNEDLYFRVGIACTAIGSSFGARIHARASIVGSSAASVYPRDLVDALVLLNSGVSTHVMSSLNPGVHFEVGDINRLPLLPIASAGQIFERIQTAFTRHESHREPSVEFLCPGPSLWRYAQDWAQLAVDRPEGAPLPEYVEQLDPEPATDHLSFALGVALGRFGAAGSAHEGILDPATADLSQALPRGLLFLDTTLAPAEDSDLRDSLGHTAAKPLLAAWDEHRATISTKRNLREWLATDFFKDVHKGMYENRPIHWPLSSANKTFVAWVNIHRMDDQTLRALLADHLLPTQARIDGELSDLREARDGADKKAAQTAEKQYQKLQKAREELLQFITSVSQCADQGAPPTDAKCPPRERDQRYAPDLDDGVMINSAALWPLLEPQWRDPKKWWKELSTASGRKDYDWAHLALRYWPTRVDAKCQADPSLGVAHGCFWRYHPERAWAWELRLQDEIGPDFRIEEAPYRPAGLVNASWVDDGDAPHRAAWLHEHADAALAAVEKEAVRRMGRGKKQKLVSELRLLEAGLWGDHPEALWAMELRLSEKQGAELRVLAPDEPAARAAFEAAHPALVVARAELLKGLVPAANLFDGSDDDDDATDDEGEDDDATDGEEDDA